MISKINIPLPVHKNDIVVGRKAATSPAPANADSDKSSINYLSSSSSMVPLIYSPPSVSRNASIVSTVTAILWIVFRILECTLWISALLWLKLTERSWRQSSFSANPRTIVIVGGSFSGLAALWELFSWQRAKFQNDESESVRIVLIDQRDYSEYTPGILRLFCEPGYFFRIAQALPETNDKINFQRIQGTVTSVVLENEAGNDNNCNPTKANHYQPLKMKKILTYLPATSSDKQTETKTLAYDYLILATGATYTSPISPETNSTTRTNMLGRYREWKDAHARLKVAKKVLILGGGAVGVELAAEIIDHDIQKRQQSLNRSSSVTVTIVDAQPALLPLFPKTVGAYAEDWLTKHGAELRLGESLKSWNERSCTLADGTALHADIVYVCFGNRPNSEPIASAHLSTKMEEKKGERTSQHVPFFTITRRRNVAVRDTLQMVITNDSNDDTYTTSWFACGDVASPPTDDEKQAFQAEMQGKVAAKNVIKLLESKRQGQDRLLRYPQDIAGADRIPLVFVLSLGKYDGVLGFNNMCISGPLAAVVKWVLEYTKVSHMRGCLLGKVIWKIGDAATLFLSRTVFRTPCALLPSSNSMSVAVGRSATDSATPASLCPSKQRHELEQQLKIS